MPPFGWSDGVGLTAYPVIPHTAELKPGRMETPRVLVPGCPSHVRVVLERLCRNTVANLHRSFCCGPRIDDTDWPRYYFGYYCKRSASTCAGHPLASFIAGCREAEGLRRRELILFTIGRSPTTSSLKIRNVL